VRHLTVQQISGTAATTGAPSPMANQKVDILMTTIGGMGPTLYIINGGTRLPDKVASGN